MSDTPIAAPAASPTPSETPTNAPETTQASAVAPTPDGRVADVQAKEASGEKLTKKEQTLLKEYNLKINGKEKSFKLDLSNDEEVKKYLQKAMASDEVFRKSNQIEKAAQSFIAELRENPLKVLSDPNLNIPREKRKQIAEMIMNEELQEMEKSPEQKEREKLQKMYESEKKARETEKNEWTQKELARQTAEHEKYLTNEISTALDIGGLPKTPRTVSMMAELMKMGLQEKLDLTPKDLAPIVRNMNESDFKEIVQSMNDDQLEGFLGKEILGRIRKRNVAKAKAAETPVVQAKAEPSADKKDDKKGKGQSYRDFFGF